MRKTLLLADDSITIQKVVGITFANEDFEIVSVDNGEDALKKAASVNPDIILADVVMPKLDGYQVCERVKADAKLRHIPVLLLTGAFKVFDEEKSRKVGANGFIAKPFDSQALIDKVNELVRQAQAQRSAAPPVMHAPAAMNQPAAAPQPQAAPFAPTPAPRPAQAIPAIPTFQPSRPPQPAAPAASPFAPAPGGASLFSTPQAAAQPRPAPDHDPFATPVERQGGFAAPPPAAAPGSFMGGGAPRAPAPAPSPAPAPQSPKMPGGFGFGAGGSVPTPAASPANSWPGSPGHSAGGEMNFAGSSPFGASPPAAHDDFFAPSPPHESQPLGKSPGEEPNPMELSMFEPPAGASFGAPPQENAAAGIPENIWSVSDSFSGTPVADFGAASMDKTPGAESQSFSASAPSNFTIDSPGSPFTGSIVPPAMPVSAPPAFDSAYPSPASPGSESKALGWEDVADIQPAAKAPSEPMRAAAARKTEEALSAHEALKSVPREVIEKIAWEIIPDLAESIIREEIERLKKDKGVFT